MKKNAKRLWALLLTCAMLMAMIAGCGGDTPATSEEPPAESSTPTESADPGGPATVTGEGYVVGPALQPDAAGVAAKWSEETMDDGWIKVTNDGGDTLGYHPDSGVTIIQVDGFAFKDLDKDGELDVYEDWRQTSEVRATDLAAHMDGERIIPYLTHGGWGTFTTDPIDEEHNRWEYINAGGRGGVTRSAGSTNDANVDHAIWANNLQMLCETLDYGIPAVVSIDPNDQAGLIESLSMAATMDPELAVEVGRAFSEQYRSMGISMLLGPQIDLHTSPLMDRGGSTYGEDPALSRDITEGFVSGMQSTWDANGNDLGWGSDSVVTTMKHYSGAGAGEGGRDDHNATGKYAVFPNDNFEAHLIPFHDGAFNLTHSSTGMARGVMMNYSVSYSDDGSLGELFGGAYSEFKYDTLFGSGWSGFIVSDWGVFGDGGGGSWGTEEWTAGERLATALMLGMTQAGGYSNLENMTEAWEIILDELGDDAALELVRDRAYENLRMTFDLELFENPYNDTARTREISNSVEARLHALETQLQSVIMLKNNDIIKQSSGGDKLTVYVPAVFTAASTSGWGGGTPASINPAMDVEVLSQYFNVITDEIGEPSGTDEEGNAVYTENDIIRVDPSGADLALVKMTAPKTASSATSNEETGLLENWTPGSLQYGEYTAVNAREESFAGDIIVETFHDGYETQTRETEENRSYKGATVGQSSRYAHLTTLQTVVDTVDCPVVVIMNMGTGAMCWHEVEPLADAILVGYAISDEALAMTIAGQNEPNGLLPVQQPKDMDAVEADQPDLPRDVECYVDANGNTYDFAFGMNWSGVINDDRVQTYKAAPLTECVSFDFQYAN